MLPPSRQPSPHFFPIFLLTFAPPSSTVWQDASTTFLPISRIHCHYAQNNAKPHVTAALPLFMITSTKYQSRANMVLFFLADSLDTLKKKLPAHVEGVFRVPRDACVDIALLKTGNSTAGNCGLIVSKLAKNLQSKP